VKAPWVKRQNPVARPGNTALKSETYRRPERFIQAIRIYKRFQDSELWVMGLPKNGAGDDNFSGFG